MNSAFIPRYSYNDYKNWKEDWELIDGHPVSLLPSPVVDHARTQFKISFQMGKAFEMNPQCDCEVISGTDWRVDEYTVARPDIMVVCGKPKTDFIMHAPVLIVEILSPATRLKDRTIKFELYKEQRVLFYLIVDHQKHTLEAFELKNNDYIPHDSNTYILEDKCQLFLDPLLIWT